MDEHEQKILTCVQVREDTISTIVPGSIQNVCAACGHKVWISRSGQSMMAEEPVVIQCLECVLKDVDPERVAAVPGAFDEIRNFLRGDG